jgi:hypothetical protein
MLGVPILTVVLLSRFGFRWWEAIAFSLLIGVLLMLALIYINPGPKARDVVERLKNRRR